MDNLQTEVLEIEFLTYSKGMTTISEEDFAKILLRFTNVENISAYLENVRQCIPDEKVQHMHAQRFLLWEENMNTKVKKEQQYSIIHKTFSQHVSKQLLGDNSDHL